MQKKLIWTDTINQHQLLLLLQQQQQQTYNVKNIHVHVSTFNVYDYSDFRDNWSKHVLRMLAKTSI